MLTKILIFSSKEGLDVAQAIQRNLFYLKYACTLWTNSYIALVVKDRDFYRQNWDVFCSLIGKLITKLKRLPVSGGYCFEAIVGIDAGLLVTG